jgi:hypothetical protein
MTSLLWARLLVQVALCAIAALLVWAAWKERV